VERLLVRLLPSSIVGSLAGFGLGILASVGSGFFGLDLSGYRMIAAAAALAAAGAVVGGLLHSPSATRRAAFQWCVLMATVVGGVAFLAGFVGPILLHPDWPQGPLLGIFTTGPFGALAGAALGLVIGAAVGRPVLGRAAPNGPAG
jgi:hypothetical protein